MSPLCCMGTLALLCLVCMASCVWAEDSSALRANDDDDTNAFSRHSRQFYRFGRAFAPLWDNEDDSLSKKSRLSEWPGYPINPVLDDDAFSRHNRQFYRFGRSYPTYQDKRFLRFGRSQLPDGNDYSRVIMFRSDEPLYRERRSTKTDLVHKDGAVGKDLQKRETTNEAETNSDHLSYDLDVNEKDKRFMRFGKRFMRFGRGDDDDASNEKRFMRFGKSLEDNQENEKRFMRFGKRFMRFGRGDELEKSNINSYLISGKSDENDNVDKRFMRFGKRFMRFGRGDDDDDDEYASRSLNNGVEEKQFMRFGKRSTASDKDFSVNSEASAAS